ncbi:MAG TPA: helix-turn-helix transcriptional regulator [Coleofasciculaceae cyanobacterium]|jgi:transcriptional regulator with XRE-family HTH domain
MWTGKALRARRLELRITQRRLAIALDVTETTVRNWESSKHIPTLTPRQTQTMCRILQLSLDEFAEFEGLAS